MEQYKVMWWNILMWCHWLLKLAPASGLVSCQVGNSGNGTPYWLAINYEVKNLCLESLE